jgi:hypothetical protein
VVRGCTSVRTKAHSDSTAVICFRASVWLPAFYLRNFMCEDRRYKPPPPRKRCRTAALSSGRAGLPSRVVEKPHSIQTEVGKRKF